MLKLSKDELDILIVQLGCRIDEFTNLKKHAMNKQDEKRFLELHEYQEKMKKIQSKLLEENCK